MPTYQNNTTSRVNVPEFGVIVNPGEVYRTRKILINLHNLTLIDILPLWNPFIISAEYPGTPSADIIIPIPETSNGLPVTNFVMDISSMSGAVKVFFTDKDNFGTPLILSAGCGYTTPVFERKVSSIILQYTRSGKTRINVSFPEEHNGIVFLT